MPNINDRIGEVLFFILLAMFDGNIRKPAQAYPSGDGKLLWPMRADPVIPFRTSEGRGGAFPAAEAGESRKL